MCQEVAGLCATGTYERLDFEMLESSVPGPADTKEGSNSNQPSLGQEVTEALGPGGREATGKLRLKPRKCGVGGAVISPIHWLPLYSELSHSVFCVSGS